MGIDELKNKKVLILGFAREGIDNFLFLRKIFPKKEIGIADRIKISNLKPQISNIITRDKYVKLHFGKNYLNFLRNYDVIIKSPGISLRAITPFLNKNQIVTSQTEIFLENCQGVVIGITGTKGKSTTSSLIYKILKEGQKKVYLVGNIGKPVLRYLLNNTKNKFFVYELSSHQLCNLKISPHVAVFLNLYPEHLDYYKNFKEYARAKSNITLHQKKEDYLVFNSKDKIIKGIARKSEAKKIPFDTLELKKIIKVKNILLTGDFNLQNVKAAITVARILGIPDKISEKAIKKFRPLPHRLELVGKFKGIEFYNDSLSTIPQATIGALNALGRKVDTIILGGFDRGVDFSELAEKIVKMNIKNLIFFPTSGERIWKEIKKKRKKGQNFNTFFVNNMKDAVRFCFEYTKKGKTCLLSCASPSFSIFKNYKEKGNLFKKYVKYFGER